MAEFNQPSKDSAKSKADALMLVAQAEAEAAEAEALVAAARAHARAAELKRQALAIAEATAEDDEADYYYEDADYDDDAEYYDDAEDAEDYEAPEEEAAKPATWRGKAFGWVRRLPLSRIAKVAAILIICGFVLLSGYFVWTHHQATERQERAVAFTAGARQGVINMTSLDFKKAKEDVQRVIDSSTGEFKDDFQARAADFTKVVEQSKVVTEGTVNATAVESMDEHSALVLVSATSRVTNNTGAKDESRTWRLRVTVTEEAGQYKMSKVEFVP
jgi:Mce-associated membrane protein